MTSVCSVESCDRNSHAFGLCHLHYSRQRRAGTTDAPQRARDRRRPIIEGKVAWVPLTRGLRALIDATDAELVGQYAWMASWCASTETYYARSMFRRPGGTRVNLTMHRLILGGDAVHTDHRNHDTLDNRRQNLRPATRVESMRNRRGWGVSGFIGVFPSSSRGKWIAKVRINGEQRYLGTFDMPEEAARVRDAWIREHHPSPFWTFNFPLLPGERGFDHRQGVSA